MPQVSGRFGPYPVSVQLDGSGNGQVEFQAVGNNVRITNGYASVSTQVAQASAVAYKNLVGPGYAVSSTESGSTGAPFKGPFDLCDGEKLIVRWEGGDVGAVATATFTGIQIPFNEISGSSIEWENPFAANDGTIVFPALQSTNYVAGISGWKLFRNGNLDVGQGTFRGEVLIRGSNGSYVRIYANGAEATIEIQPPTSGTATFTPGSIKATSAANVPLVEFVGAAPLTPVPGGAGQLNLGADPVLNQTAAQLLAQQVVIGDPSAGSTVQIESTINWGAVTPSVAVQDSDTAITNGTTSSTSYVTSLTTSGVRGVAFVAPPSGKISISATCGGFNNTVGGFTLLSCEVRLGAVVGAGVVINASNDLTASQFQSQAVNQPGPLSIADQLVGALTPGTAYNGCMTFRTANVAHVGSFNRRNITVKPEF